MFYLVFNILFNFIQLEDLGMHSPFLNDIAQAAMNKKQEYSSINDRIYKLLMQAFVKYISEGF